MDPYAVGDSFTIAALDHIYEGLVRYDENLEIEPALADPTPGICSGYGVGIRKGDLLPLFWSVH